MGGAPAHMTACTHSHAQQRWMRLEERPLSSQASALRLGRWRLCSSQDRVGGGSEAPRERLNQQDAVRPLGSGSVQQILTHAGEQRTQEEEKRCSVSGGGDSGPSLEDPRTSQDGQQHPQVEEESPNRAELISIPESQPQEGEIRQLLAAGMSRQAESRYHQSSRWFVCL